MKKCPNCGGKTIKNFNKYNLLPDKATSCPKCKESINSSLKFTWMISIPYIVFVVVLFIVHVPIDQNFVQFMLLLLGSGVVMYIVQNLLIPYEVSKPRRKK